MALISQEFGILVFLVLVILAIVVSCWYEKYEIYDKGTFHIFVSVFCSIGVIITFLFYYNLLLLQNQEQQLETLQELSRIDESIINNIYESINQNSSVIPNFVSSINPLVTYCTGGTGCIADDPINPQTITSKNTLSNKIFSHWQNIILSNKIIKFDPLSYVSHFLQRANSTQLYQQWLISKFNYLRNTQIFGDLLFEYGMKIINQVPEEYLKEANNLLLDPRYLLLLTV
jgi:hypothetical protein